MQVDFEEMRQHLTSGSRLEAVLRGHLWAEVLVNCAIESALPHPEALRLDRMSFSAKLSLGHAVGVLDPVDMPWFRTLNKMRNRLAHDLQGAPTDAEVASLETALAGEARALFVSLANEYSRTNERLVLVFATQLVRLEHDRRIRVYEDENREALQRFRLQAALHDLAGNEMSEVESAAMRSRWGIPPAPSVWEVVGRQERSAHR